MAKPTRSLVDHTDDVVAAFVALFGEPGEPTRFAKRWLAFFKLGEADEAPFLLNGLAACLVHDWGKANAGFAAMLAEGEKQSFRHEFVSALIMVQPEVRRWLESAGGLDLPLLLGAVAGHHLKAAEPAGGGDSREFGAIQPGSLGGRLALTWHHPRIREHLGVIAERLGIPGPPPEDVPRRWDFRRPDGRTLPEFDKMRRRLGDLIGRTFEEDPASTRARMLRAVRSALIAADSAGSALFRTHGEAGRSDDVRSHIRSWIAEAFDPAANLDEEGVLDAVVRPSVRAASGDVGSFAWNEFQEACGDAGRVPSRALLIAPCGSGKTLAAWRWVAARCRERPIARAIFLYPTRGTATEGFRDYVGHAGPGLAALVHGTAELDLERLQPDVRVEDRIAEARLFALRQWPKRVFSATVDQFLAFLQHDYGSTCLLPLLADSAVVLDEVHSYDRGMFTALVQFLEHFDVPVLAMTATMMERRKNDLRKLTIVEGLGFGGDASRLRRIADHPRYQVASVAGADEAKREVESALREGRRVLWVFNTVDRAQALARDLAADPRADVLATREGSPLLCYHSRFKLVDRRERHEAIVSAFKTAEGRPRRAVLGIATQVCEMSLDLDCDLLVTEHAPVSALIQRFGRCCRDQRAHEEGRRRTGRVVLYAPESNLPYERDELKGVLEFIASIEGAVVSQSDLEDRLASLDGSTYLSKDARFLVDGPWAAAGQDHFRDSEDRSRQAILPIDERDYEALSRSRERWRAQELIVPIPKGAVDASNRPPWMPSWLSFADVKRHEYLPPLGYVARSGGGFQIA